MRQNRVIRLLLVSGVALSACLVGCSNESRVGEFRSNPTPELQTLSETQHEIDNSLTVMSDSNFRLMAEDWGRFWHADRPSRLTPRSMPY